LEEAFKPKLSKIPRFDGLVEFWLGGDYVVGQSWKWRDSRQDFNGKLLNGS